jgi:hypothetical protein
MRKYEAAMRITTQAEADVYFEKLVADSMVAHGLGRQEAEICERVNLGYWAGYYRSEIRRRVDASTRFWAKRTATNGLTKRCLESDLRLANWTLQNAQKTL